MYWLTDNMQRECTVSSNGFISKKERKKGMTVTNNSLRKNRFKTFNVQHFQKEDTFNGISLWVDSSLL